MMENFQYHMYTDIVFGKGAEKQVAKKVKEYGGTKVMLVYGGGSVKRSGLYDIVVAELNDAGIPFIELGGVQPNPRLSLVKKGLEQAKAEGADFFLAVGGGSVIDTAKAIALGMVYGDDFWKIFQKKLVPTQMAPVGTIHTISATGSETSRSSVIKDDLDTQHKFGFMLEPCRPVFALMNPEWTMTLPAYQTAAGASDIFAHTVERYFAEGDCYLGDKFCEGLLRSVVKYAPIAIKDPKNYDAHAELMLAGSFSHNDTTGLGRLGMDGSCHGLETQVSGLFDTAHGAGLAVIMPAWMEFMIDTQEDIHQFVKFATNVFDVEYDMQDPKGVALEGVKCFRAWLKEIGMPLTFKELGVKKEDMQKLLDHTCKKDGSVGHHIPLYYDDVKRIFDSVVE